MAPAPRSRGWSGLLSWLKAPTLDEEEEIVSVIADAFQIEHIARIVVGDEVKAVNFVVKDEACCTNYDYLDPASNIVAQPAPSKRRGGWSQFMQAKTVTCAPKIAQSREAIVHHNKHRNVDSGMCTGICSASCRRVIELQELMHIIGDQCGIAGARHLSCADANASRSMRGCLRMLASKHALTIHVFGGQTQNVRPDDESGGEIDVSMVDSFNVVSSSWKASSRMEVARSGCAAATMGGHIFIVGGGIGGGNGVYPQPLAAADRFTPSSGQWHELPDMTSPRLGCAAAAAGGVLCVVGGLDDYRPLRTTEAFLPSSNRWIPLPAMGSQRYGCAAAIVSGKLFAVGGGAPDRLRSVEGLEPATAALWSKVPDMTSVRYGCAAVSLAGALFVIGGSDAECRPLASVERLDMRTWTWASVTEMCIPRVGCSAVATRAAIYVLGGRFGDHGDTALAAVERLHIDQLDRGSWGRAPSLPTARVGCAAAVAVLTE